MRRIAVLTSRWPYPPLSGENVRILEICRQLARAGHRLELLALTDRGDLPPPEPGLFASVEQVRVPAWQSRLHALAALAGSRPLQVAYYDSGAMRRAAARALERADAVLCHLIRMAPFVPAEFRGTRVLELTDAISLGYSRITDRVRHGGLLSTIYRIEQPRVAAFEAACAEAFDASFVVSEVDRAYLAARAPRAAAKIAVAMNGVAPERFRCRPDLDGREILFIGNMRTLPNIDAVVFFAQECLPRIREREPDATLKVVGPVPPRVLRRLERDCRGVRLVGEVPDLNAAAAGAFCAVAPMRLGAGVQNKVLDYLAMGLPCVTTPVGYEGLHAAPGEDLVVAATPDELADAVVALRRDPAMRARIGGAGRRYAQARHAWDRCLAPLLEAFR